MPAGDFQLEPVTSVFSDGIPSFGSTAPPPPAEIVGHNPTTNEMFVNGTTFSVDDAKSALDTRANLDKPPQALPAGFNAVTPESYVKYIGDIKNPSIGTVFSKNLGIGVDVTQELAGSALSFLGATDTGQAIVDQQRKDLSFNEPFQRNFTDIKSVGDAGEWFVANIAQMAPLMVEMMITSAVTGGAAGAAAGAKGIVGAGGRFLAKSGAKEAQALGKAKFARLARKGAAEARNGKLVAGSDQALALKQAGRVGGAKIGAWAASGTVAAGDIFGAIQDSGNFDSPTLARLATIIGIPLYAAAEFLPAKLAAKTAFKGLGQSLKKGARAKNIAVGTAVGGTLEGLTEGFQESLTLGLSGQLDLNNPQVVDRLINATAAGVGFGAPIGGAAKAFGRSEQAPAAADPNAPPTAPSVDTNSENSDILQRELFTPGVDLGNVPTQLADGQVQGELLSGASLDTPVDVLKPSQGELNLSAPGQGMLDVAQPLPDTVPPLETGTNITPPIVPPQNPGTFTVPPIEAVPLSARPAPFNAAIAEQLRPLQAQQQQQAQDAAQQAAATQQQLNAAQEAQFVQAEQAAQQVADTQAVAAQQVDVRQQPQLPLPPPPLAPLRTLRPSTTAATGEPTISIPTRAVDTGEVFLAEVPVRQALDESKSRISALEALKKCLAAS